ncbi:MAG: hypothetical protein ACI3ZC_09910 [Candidatus Cryptobacteroides sp.]
MRKILPILLTIVAALVFHDLAQDTCMFDSISLSCSNGIELPAASSCRDAASPSMEHDGSFRQITLADIGFIAPQNISVPGAPSGQFTRHQSTGARAEARTISMHKSGHIVDQQGALQFFTRAGLMPSGHTSFSHHIISLRKLRC